MGLDGKDESFRAIMAEIHEVVPGLFITCQQAAESRSEVIDRGITHIVNCAAGCKNVFTSEGVKYHNVAVLDARGVKISSHLDGAADFIAAALHVGEGCNNKVLCHCVWGMSRAATIIVAYLIKYHKVTLAGALNTVTTARSIVRPNSDFMRQLIEYEKKILSLETPSVDIDSYKVAMKLKSTSSKTVSDLLDSVPSRSGDSKLVLCNSHVMSFTPVSQDPRMATIENFVTMEEADHLISLAKQKGLHASKVVDKASSGDLSGDSGRTSSNCRVDRNDGVVVSVCERAALLCNMTPLHTEPIQVVHYDKTQRYDAHNDWFDPAGPSYKEKMEKRGQREVTIFAYLADVEGGGCTYFPRLDIRFTPKKGSAVLWYNRDRNGNMDERVLHAGEPVTSGEKWGLNVWMREKPMEQRAATAVS